MATIETLRKAQPPPGGADEDLLWGRFAAAQEGAAFVQGWLALQLAFIAGVRAALVLFEDAEGHAFAPIAASPADVDYSRLKAIAERSIQTREGEVERETERDADSRLARLSYPIIVAGHLSGLVLLEIEADDAGVQRGLRQLHWGVGWLEAEVLRRRNAESRDRLDRAAFALDVLAVASEHETLEGSAIAIVNELALRLGCDRVAVALADPRARLKLLAISNTAWFRKRASLVDDLENAMEETLDQAASIAWPEAPGVARGIDVAHRAYAAAQDARHLLSTVLFRRGAPVGVLTFERRDDRPFDRASVLAAEAVGELLGPLLELERRQRRWLSGRVPEAVENFVRKLFGPRHASIKIGAGAAVLALAVLTFWPADFRVSARAVLEGAQQRAAAAPFQGFVAGAKARAGDVVKRGDVLAELDDKDLRLDLSRWKAEYARLSQEKRKALAALDRTEVALVEAQLQQAQAQLDLTLVKLERARIEAPIDGVIVSGDWSQKLGAPVEQGSVMFEISPLWSYRVNLKVDETDIRHVEAGQRGSLLLSGRADAVLPFEVTRVTSVSNAEEGQNLFRVEATLPEAGRDIRPGMEGVGKIMIGRRSLGYVWSRRLIDWARLALWRNTP